MEDLAFFLELLEVIKIFFNYENWGGGGEVWGESISFCLHAQFTMNDFVFNFNTTIDI